MLKKILPFLLLMLVNSCTVYGLTNDYKKLNPEQQRNIIPLTSFDETNAQHIYKINGAQLREELKKHPRSMVYIFANGCTSNYCLPMSAYENYAKKNGYSLFLVMDGYARLSETTKQRSEVFTAPLYAMDSDYYNKKIRNTYSKYFENDLRGLPHKTKNEWQGNLFFFENGQLVKTVRDLP